MQFTLKYTIVKFYNILINKYIYILIYILFFLIYFYIEYILFIIGLVCLKAMLYIKDLLKRILM